MPLSFLLQVGNNKYFVELPYNYMNPAVEGELIMPSVIQLRERLLKKLKELFQLDQPDLDFGFYRIICHS